MGMTISRLGWLLIFHRKADKSTAYTKTDVDGLLAVKATITYVDNAIANQSTLTVNTLTTSRATLNVKSDLVQFQGTNNTAYMNTSPTGISAYTDLYVDATINCKRGISVQQQIGISTWAGKCDISNHGYIQSEGNGSFTGTLSAVGDITSSTGNITSSIGNVSAYGNLQSYNGNITAP